MKTSVLPLLILLSGCTATRDGGFGYTQHPKRLPPGPPVSFVWPTASGWQREANPFPLAAAPDLPFRGTEERRLAPGFSEPSAPGFGSLVVVWWIEAGPRLERATIERSSSDYFGGEAHLVANVEPGLVGSVRTSKALLYLHAKTGACGDHHFLLIEASPRPTNDPMWAALNEVAASFQCK